MVLLEANRVRSTRTDVARPPVGMQIMDMHLRLIDRLHGTESLWL
jgi:hypothetical protein